MTSRRVLVIGDDWRTSMDAERGDCRVGALAVLLLVVILGACGDDGSPSLVCEAFDLDDANALVTNGDTGTRRIDGVINAAVLVETTASFRGSPVGIVAVNVDGVIVTLVEVLPEGPWASMDDVSERATNFPQDTPYSISEDAAGVAEAQECAEAGEQPTTTAPASGFDVEEWRAQAIERFGPEETFDDGSKDDYVFVARQVCDQSDEERATMLENLGSRYDGSLQQFIIDEFCPNV